MKVQVTYDDTLYQLVPKEPTDRIKRAIFVMLASADDEDCFYRKVIEMASLEAASLLSAAPTPPAQPKLPPGFHNCTFSNEPVQTAVFIASESAQPAEQPPIPESLWRSILDAGLTLHKEGDEWWVEKAQPADRMPLTEEQRAYVVSMWKGGNWNAGDIIDAVEAAHGITEP